MTEVTGIQYTDSYRKHTPAEMAGLSFDRHDMADSLCCDGTSTKRRCGATRSQIYLHDEQAEDKLPSAARYPAPR